MILLYIKLFIFTFKVLFNKNNTLFNKAFNGIIKVYNIFRNYNIILNILYKLV